ncbi:MAG: hypothetical protein HamCj_02140 [Candidatus Hamiltonella defensa (Ceratovacuna japonica)]
MKASAAPIIRCLRMSNRVWQKFGMFINQVLRLFRKLIHEDNKLFKFKIFTLILPIHNDQPILTIKLL